MILSCMFKNPKEMQFGEVTKAKIKGFKEFFRTDFEE